MRTLAAVLGLLCLAGPATAQGADPQTPIFRSAVESVDVDVRVTDRNGRVVRDLSAGDFEIRVNGKRQPVTNVSLIDLVPGASGTADLAKMAPPAAALNGRIYVLVLDDLQTGAGSSLRVRSLAKQFIERSLTANDRMIIRISGGGPSHGFTGDKALLHRVVDGFNGRKLPPASIEESNRRATLQELRTWGSADDPYARERGMNARASLLTLRDAAASLSEWPGRRKAIVMISEGIDYDITDAVGRPDKPAEADAILQDMRSAVDAANRTNASFYTIDPRGLAQNAGDSASVGSVDRRGSNAMRKELQMSQSSLREIADTTGGFAAVNANNLAPIFDRIVADTTTYYMLSFTPPADEKSGAFQKIEVRVTRRGLRVRARPGYSSAPRAAAVPMTSAPATPAPAAAPVAVALPAPPIDPDPVDASLALVLSRTAAYVAEYQVKLAGIVAEERYHQEVRNQSGTPPTRTIPLTPQRDLRSDLLLVRPEGEDRWMQFRDVFEVDRKAVRDRDERLFKLFVEPSVRSLTQADQIQAEGARYNIGPLTRTMNVPILALIFLDAANQPRFEYSRARPGNLRDFAGLAAERDIWVIEYKEVAPQTLIRSGGNRDLPSRGRVWVDGPSGRVLRTELIARDPQVSAEVTVTYKTDPAIDLLVPVQMEEHYLLNQLSIRIEGEATYSRFRQFKVVTDEKPKPR